jgi:hypothetical protein
MKAMRNRIKQACLRNHLATISASLDDLLESYPESPTPGLTFTIMTEGGPLPVQGMTLPANDLLEFTAQIQRDLDLDARTALEAFELTLEPIWNEWGWRVDDSYTVIAACSEYLQNAYDAMDRESGLIFPRQLVDHLGLITKCLKQLDLGIDGQVSFLEYLDDVFGPSAVHLYEQINARLEACLDDVNEAAVLALEISAEARP